MRLADIEPMCKRYGRAGRGCPHDGLGCPYGDRCNLPANATRYGPNADEVWCVKREAGLTKPKDAGSR